jgi:hypothetical protein
VGYQVCRRLFREDHVDELAIVSLYREEVLSAVERLREEFPRATVRGFFGNVFARGRLADAETETATPFRDRADPDRRRDLLSDIYEDFEQAKENSALVAFLLDFKPAAVVDCINTATAISYQDVPTAAKRLMSDIGIRGEKPAPEHLREDLESLLVSIEVPQLVLHVRLLHAALKEAGTEIYVKIGTTGTGGMGLNIPYTHGEDKPSPTLMAKSAVAFAHTGLLFLASRTEGPAVKELKPAAMIGYREVEVREVPGYVWEKRGNRFAKKKTSARPIYRARSSSLSEPLDMRPDVSTYEITKDPGGTDQTIRIPCVNTGENGWFAHGEFEAITALGQMEMITPEEIALDVVQELQGRATGHDVLVALDASILTPTYKGGLVRQVAVDRLMVLEENASIPSVALGDLGPPQLSKYLFELYLFREAFETLERTAEELRTPGAASRLQERLQDLPALRDTIVSVGIPILMADGETILRGPEIKIPGYDPGLAPHKAKDAEIDAWAYKGWVDLRPKNLDRWAGRFDRLLESKRGGAAGASDHMSHETFGRDDFRIGEVVAWVFANEPEYRGVRVK